MGVDAPDLTSSEKVEEQFEFDVTFPTIVSK